MNNWEASKIKRILLFVQRDPRSSCFLCESPYSGATDALETASDACKEILIKCWCKMHTSVQECFRSEKRNLGCVKKISWRNIIFNPDLMCPKLILFCTPYLITYTGSCIIHYLIPLFLTLWACSQDAPLLYQCITYKVSQQVFDRKLWSF